MPEPDIEDLIKCDKDTKECLLDHDEKYHHFSKEDVKVIQKELLDWYDENRRKLPWRGDPPPYLSTSSHTKSNKIQLNKLSDYFKQEKESGAPSFVKEESLERNKERRKVLPYETWVSEIMLQQTRVDTVVDYFLRWTEKFPTIQSLAEANEEDVNALWAGLGYYRRARMLHAGAKYIVENYNGELPSSVEKLLTIPGIGPYTAGAISSIAFENQVPLVDGNVIRVFSRLRAIGADPKNKQLNNLCWKLGKDLVGECDRPGELNQALMELGATVCTAPSPSCNECPVKNNCFALMEASTKKRHIRRTGIENDKIEKPCFTCDISRADEWNDKTYEVTRYPLKAKKNDSKNEVLCVAVISCGHMDTNLSEKNKKSPEEKTAKKKSGRSALDVESHRDLLFLMTKRPEGGLLAGQWEFVHLKVADSDTIPSFDQRQATMDTYLSKVFHKKTLKENKMFRRDIGDLKHIFSHVTHHMGIEHIHFEQKDISSPDTGTFTFPPTIVQSKSSTTGCEIRWMKIEEMQSLGITTGVHKILQRVLSKKEKVDTKKPPSSQVKRPSSTTGSTVKKVVSISRGMADHSVDQNDLFDLMPQVIPLNKKPIEKQNKKASDIIPFAFDHGTKNSSNSIVTIRELVSKDLEEFKSLHEEWFPIRYNQAFYDGAETGFWSETATPLYTRLAIETIHSSQDDPVCALEANTNGSERILGAVTANISTLDKVEDIGLFDNPIRYTEVMYILTLGTRTCARRRGIASILIQKCIEIASKRTKCGAVYLHVKADNESAIRFYEKLGFQNLRFLEDYYLINGVRYDAYLYIKYINGASPQTGWLEYITRPFLAFFTMASRSWKKIVFYAYKETEGTSSSAASAAATAATNYNPISFV